MMQVRTYQTPPPSETKTASSKSPTASPLNRTPQGRTSSANNTNNTTRQEQKSQSRNSSSNGNKSNNDDEVDEEEDEASWVFVAQQQDEMDKIISAVSPSQIMARPLRTPNQRSATKNKAEKEEDDVEQQEQEKFMQENNEWNWKEAKIELSKIKQRLIVKLFPIQKPKQKHYKNFMIQPVSDANNKEPVDFPIEQFVDESPLKQFVDCQPAQPPNFDPKSFPSEIGQFGSMNPQKVPDPDDFILQQLPSKLEIPSTSPEEEEEEIPPSKPASEPVDQVNPQMIVRDSNEVVSPQLSNVDLQKVKAEINALEHQLERRNVVLDRLSVRRIASLEKMLEKKQKQVAVLSHRLRMNRSKQSLVASSSSSNEPISVVASNIHVVDQPQQLEHKQKSPGTTTIRTIQIDIIRLERALDQRKKNIEKLKNRLLLLKRIQHRHELIHKLKSNLAASRQ